MQCQSTTLSNALNVLQLQAELVIRGSVPGLSLICFLLLCCAMPLRCRPALRVLTSALRMEAM